MSPGPKERFNCLFFFCFDFIDILQLELLRTLLITAEARMRYTVMKTEIKYAGLMGSCFSKGL